MERRIYYFKASHAIAEHDWIIEHSGGLAGIKDSGQIESILEHIQNDLYYPTFEEKLTHLVFSFIKLHAFNDGNKRSGIALGAYFLKINGYDYSIPTFTKELENIVVWVAEGLINKCFLQKIITELISDLELSEITKLELILTVTAD